MAKLLFRAILAMAALGGTATARAEVTNTADNGFTVQHQAVIAGDAEAVWKAMTAPARYWNSDHSWTRVTISSHRRAVSSICA